MTALFVFLSIVVLIWAEITVFGLIGSVVGVLLTIIGVFVTAAIGLRLFRHFGKNTLRRMAEVSAMGKPPVAEVADGIAIMMAAVLLLIPGYVTDAAGLVFFIPGLRVILVVGVLGGMLSRISASHFAAAGRSGGFGKGFGESFPPGENPFHHPEDDQHLSENDPADVTIEGEFERKD